MGKSQLNVSVAGFLLISSVATAVGSTLRRRAQTLPRGPSTVGGDRPALLFFPDSYDDNGEKLWPLILMIHGYGSDSYYHDRFFGLTPHTTSHGFIALLPNGTLNHAGLRGWNGLRCCDFDHNGIDDVAYLTGIVKEAVATLKVDPKRVYVLGHSNGGAMSQILGCWHADLFAGIATVTPGEIPDACSPGHPISMLEVCVTDDPYVHWDLCMEVVDTWKKNDGCIRNATTSGVFRDYDCDPGRPVGDNTGFNEYHDSNCKLPGNETEITAWDQCGANQDLSVEFWYMHGARHTPNLSPAWTEDMLTWLLSQKYIPADSGRL